MEGKKTFEAPKIEKGIEKKSIKQEKSLESSIENDTEKEIVKLENNTEALQKDIEEFGGEEKLQAALTENSSLNEGWNDKAARIAYGIGAFISGISLAVWTKIGLDSAQFATLKEQFTGQDKSVQQLAVLAASASIISGIFTISKFIEKTKNIDSRTGLLKNA